MAQLVQLPIFFFKILFIYSRETPTERERQRHRQREKQPPCREPDVGLDPGSPGSRPGLQAVLNRCATGAALIFICFNFPLKFPGYSIPSLVG